MKGSYEFDSPYWDDISDSGELQVFLMMTKMIDYHHSQRFYYTFNGAGSKKALHV